MIISTSVPASLEPRTPKRLPADREFLPAALEILDTPPSPVRIWLMLLICAFTACALAWAWFGRIDIIAIAQGKIQSTGRVKLVQSLETGKVSAILARNGQLVAEGDILIELDDREARAEESALVSALSALRGETHRRAAAVHLSRVRDLTVPDIEWPTEIPEGVRIREANVLRGDIGQLSAARQSLLAQRAQKDSENARLTDTIAAQMDLVTTLRRNLEMQFKLQELGAGTELKTIVALESVQLQIIQLSHLKGYLGENIAARDSIDQDISKLISNFIAENSQKLADAEKQADEIAQRLVKARLRIANMYLRAPASGTVQASSITTLGQVLAVGEEIMRVVPKDAGFEIECYLPNKDIGFVSVGQEAVVKIEAFPFTRYGSLGAKVTHVSLEAIPEPDAQQLEASAGKMQRMNTIIGGAQRMQNLVFPLTLVLDSTMLNNDGIKTPISNGMAVNVEIRTGDRRIIDYIMSPLAEVGSRALKER